MVRYWRAVAGLGSSDTDGYHRARARLRAHVLVRKPNDPELWIESARDHAEVRQWAGAGADFTKAISLKPGAAEPRVERGRAHAELGQWGQAAADLVKAVEIGVGAGEWLIFHEAALARRGSGDLRGYRDLCARMLGRFGQTEDPDTAWGVALTCALAPDAVPDLSRPVRLAEKAVAGENPSFGPNWRYRSTLALALYRAGRHDAALQRVKEAMAASPEGENGANWLLLAMIHHRLGHAQEAHRWLKKGLGWRVESVVDWHDRLLYQLLRREAAALLGEGAGTDGVPASRAFHGSPSPGR